MSGEGITVRVTVCTVDGQCTVHTFVVVDPFGGDDGLFRDIEYASECVNSGTGEFRFGNPEKSYDAKDVSKIKVSIDELSCGGGSTVVAGKVLDRLKGFRATGGDVIANFDPASTEDE